MSFFKNLFKEVCIVEAGSIPPLLSSSPQHGSPANAVQAGVKDVVTLFHNPKLPASTRVHTLLKQLNATSVSHATEDQASSHQKQSKLERTEFELGMCWT